MEFYNTSDLICKHKNRNIAIKVIVCELCFCVNFIKKRQVYKNIVFASVTYGHCNNFKRFHKRSANHSCLIWHCKPTKIYYIHENKSFLLRIINGTDYGWRYQLQNSVLIFIKPMYTHWKKRACGFLGEIYYYLLCMIRFASSLNGRNC